MVVFCTNAHEGVFIQQGEFLPDKQEDFELLLRILVLEKAIYELGYELNNRPEWVPIPLRGIRQLITAEDEG